jgi:hypothetical protein
MKAYRVYNYVPYEGDYNPVYYLSERQAEAEVIRRKTETHNAIMGYEYPKMEEIELIEESF